MTSLPSESLGHIIEQTRIAAQIVCQRYAAMNELTDVTLKFENGEFVYKVNRIGDKIEIICGDDMRPTNGKEFNRLMKEVFAYIVSQKKNDWRLVSEISNGKNVDRQYDNLTNKHLLPEGRIKYMRFTSILLRDDVTGETIKLEAANGNIWDLYKEAHIKLSKKVLGE